MAKKKDWEKYYAKKDAKKQTKVTRIDKALAAGDKNKVTKIVNRREPKWDRQINRREKRLGN